MEFPPTTIETRPVLPTAQPSRPIILFDGVCNFCNSSVQFIIRRDPRGRFQFASLQSEAAAALLKDHRVPTLPDSMVVLEDGRIYTQSTAVLRIARRLRWPWPLTYLLIAIPRPLRDWAYGIIARNRYRWFGRRDSCMVPTPEQRQRFLG